MQSIGQKDPIFAVHQGDCLLPAYSYSHLFRRLLILIASYPQRPVTFALSLAAMHWACRLSAINCPCKYLTEPHAILPGCLSIGWTTNLPSLATARPFVGQKTRRLAHLKPGHVRPLFSRLAEPCCKGLDKPHGRTSLIINWPILTPSQIVPS